MMTVFVILGKSVFSYQNEGYKIRGIFTNNRVAEDTMNELKKNEGSYMIFQLEAHELNPYELA